MSQESGRGLAGHASLLQTSAKARMAHSHDGQVGTGRLLGDCPVLLVRDPATRLLKIPYSRVKHVTKTTINSRKEN